ncbi:MAG: Smr/MutS family protein [Spirochaetales bacterium]
MDPKWLELYPPEDKDNVSPREPDYRKNPKKLPIEATIDLHGCRVPEALAQTRLFIDESVRAGRKKVLVIHGKGDAGNGVLKREVRAILEGDRRVGAMGHPGAADGGSGALWVILRTS